VLPCNAKKEPLTPNGFKNATTDKRKIRMWWKRWPDALIGMPTGPASGVFVADVDRLAALGELPYELPETLTARTRRPGLHYYFEHLDGIRNSSGSLPEGIDIRGDGGYVIVPPTPGYSWEVRAPIATAPEWLLNLIREKPDSPGPNGVGVQCGRTTLTLDDTAPIPDGERNHALASIGGRLRAYGLERGDIEASLMQVNDTRCSPPLEAGEVAKIAKSVSRYEPGNGTPPPDAETAAAIDEIEAALWRSPWPKIGGKSERSLVVVLLKLARRYGRRRASLGDVEVDISHRALALAAATSTKSVQRAISRSAWLRQGKAGKGTKSGSIVMCSPAGGGSGGRAKGSHSTTLLGRGSDLGPLNVENGSSVDTLRAPFSAPRVRWSAPGNLRLGKSAEAVIDYLEKRSQASVSIEDLADYMGVSRMRDFKRRVIARLEERGIATVSGEYVSLVENWLDALNIEREASGEIDAYRRDMERFNRQREAYKNRDKNKADIAPSEEDMDLERLQRVQDALDVLQEPGTGPAMILQTYLSGQTKTFEYVVNAVAYHYGRSSPEVWREAVKWAAELIAAPRAPLEAV